MTTSSLAHNDDSHNEISGVMPAAHQSASVAPSSDAIAASPGDSDSATTTPNTIRISIDGHDVRISPLDIADPNFSEQLLARIAAASRLVVSDWERVAALPNDPRNAFLTLATIKGPLVTIRVGETPFPDAFAATLALSVNGEDLGEVARYQEFVLEAAARCHPGAVSEAARRLRDRLRVQNLQSDDLRVLARRIREQIPNPQNSGEFTPQKAADVVLAQLQEMRALRGEDTSETPPARFWNGELYRWTGQFWQLVQNFEQVALRILQEQIRQSLTISFVQSVTANVNAKVLLEYDNCQPPFVIETESPPVIRPAHVLVFLNGSIDIDEMFRAGQLPCLLPHDPRLFCTSVLPYRFDREAACPLWLATLDEIFAPLSADDRRRELLQEFAGYLLMIGDHRFETFLVLVGQGANGKSTILSTITHLLGFQNVSHVSLECFGKDAHLYEMANKLANIANDMPRVDKVEEGTLKSLVSGEPRQVDRKFRRAITMYPTAKLIFATNHLPALADTTAGIWRRVIVVPFQQHFVAANCDRSRKTRLLQELPGIMNWALAGAFRLLHQDAFTQCNVCEMARAEYQHDSDPFRQFIDERCEQRIDSIVLADAAYKAYQEFCWGSGRRGPKGKSEFGRQLKQQPGVSRQRESSGERRWYYLGLALRSSSIFGICPHPPLRDTAGAARGTMVGTTNSSQMSQ